MPMKKGKSQAKKPAAAKPQPVRAKPATPRQAKMAHRPKGQ